MQIIDDSVGSALSEAAAKNAACADTYAYRNDDKRSTRRCSKPARADEALHIREARNNDELEDAGLANLHCRGKPVANLYPEVRTSTVTAGKMCPHKLQVPRRPVPTPVPLGFLRSIPHTGSVQATNWKPETPP